MPQIALCNSWAIGMGHITRRIFLVTLSVLTFASWRRPANAQKQPQLRSDSRVALKGHDPVSYFTVGKPEKGTSAFKAAYDDAEYWFTSAKHRDLFIAEPDRYAPQYGGFCANTVARGGIVEPDPAAWTIHDGKLYVFRVIEGPTIFRENASGTIGQANQNWHTLHKKP